MPDPADPSNTPLSPLRRRRKRRTPAISPPPPDPSHAPATVEMEAERTLDAENVAVAPLEADAPVAADLSSQADYPADAAAPATPDDAAEPAAQPEPGLSLATVIGGPDAVGRPTWLDVPSEQVGTLLGLFADEGARLVAMTVLPPDADGPPNPAAPPASALDLRYHFVVYQTAITVSTRTPLRSAPSAAERFPALAWRERELAGEYGLRFVAPADEAGNVKRET